MEILAFIFVSILVIILPGPNVLVIVSTSVSHGKLRGLQTVIGTSTAMVIQLFIAAIGTAWFVASLTQGFLWLKWAGVIYLIYLGIKNLLDAVSHFEAKPISAIGSFQRGFWISLTNPKTILFFSAFLPQFVSPSESYLVQIVLLSSVFWIMATLLDSGYALVAAKVTSFLRHKKLHRYQSGLSGLLYLAAGATLAIAKIRE